MLKKKKKDHTLTVNKGGATAAICEKQTGPQLHLTRLGGGHGGLCNSTPTLAPVLSSPSPTTVTPFPPRYPSFLLARPLSNIQPKQRGAEMANWPLAVWRDEPCLGPPEGSKLCAPFAAATAGWQQPRHPSKTFIRLLAS